MKKEKITETTIELLLRIIKTRLQITTKITATKTTRIDIMIKRTRQKAITETTTATTTATTTGDLPLQTTIIEVFSNKNDKKLVALTIIKLTKKKKNDQNKVDYYLKSEFKTTLNNFKEENQTTKLVNFSSFNHFFLVLNLNSLIAVLNNMKIVKSSKFV